jgi:putative tryptophan/tyrosine transport system substrate-binding protein
MSVIRRREFVTLAGGAAVAWPVAARAQRGEQTRRIGVLAALAEDEPEMRARLAAFRQELEKRGWSEGRNISIDTRYAPAATTAQAAVLANELLAMQPAAVVAMATPATTAFQRFERAALVFNPKTAPFYEYYRGSSEAAASSLGIELMLNPIENAATDIEQSIELFARVPHSGLVVLPDVTTTAHRDLLIALAARFKLPATYSLRSSVSAGGLLSYSTDRVDQFRQAASYVDRILRGANPADLPVLAPTKYETALNLKLLRHSA